jgi:hypothetical protein
MAANEPGQIDWPLILLRRRLLNRRHASNSARGGAEGFRKMELA